MGREQPAAEEPRDQAVVGIAEDVERNRAESSEADRCRGRGRCGEQQDEAQQAGMRDLVTNMTITSN